MPWFKTDDAFWRHRKVRKLGRDKVAAAGLWTLAGTWCSDNLTDGFIPREQVETWDPKLRLAARLVEVKLWHEVEHDGEQGYQYHDWPDYNPTRAKIEAEREAWRAKKASQRKTGTRPPMSPGDTQRDTRETTQEKPPENPQQTPPESPPRFPDPIPVPVPNSGYLGGNVQKATARETANRPPDRCTKHAGQPDDGTPCGGCARARETAETWDHQQHRATTTAIRACTWCDGDGWRWHPDGKAHGVLGQRCNHTPPREAS